MTALDDSDTTAGARSPGLTFQDLLDADTNPVQDVLRIICTGRATTSVRLIDQLGRVVLVDNTFVPDGATRTVNMSLIPAGIYYVQINGKEFVRMERVVK